MTIPDRALSLPEALSQGFVSTACGTGRGQGVRASREAFPLGFSSAPSPEVAASFRNAVAKTASFSRVFSGFSAGNPSLDSGGVAHVLCESGRVGADAVQGFSGSRPSRSAAGSDSSSGVLSIHVEAQAFAASRWVWWPGAGARGPGARSGAGARAGIPGRRLRSTPAVSPWRWGWRRSAAGGRRSGGHGRRGHAASRAGAGGRRER